MTKEIKSKKMQLHKLTTKLTNNMHRHSNKQNIHINTM